MGFNLFQYKTLFHCTMHRLIYCLFGLLVFCSCSRNRIVVERLEEIEQQIQENPYQALLLLDSVAQAEPDAMSDEAVLSKYIMLDAYCKYRLVKEDASDSLLSLAESYYRQYGTDRELALCLFLHANNLFTAKKEHQALLKFKEAETAGLKTDDHFLMGQIYSQYSFLCNAMCDSDFCIYAEKALQEYKKSGREEYILDGMMNYGVALFDIHRNEESLAQLKEVLPYAEAQADSFCLAKCYTYMGAAEVNAQHFDSALVYLNRAIGYRNPYFMGRACTYIVRCHGHFKQRDSVEYYLDLARTYLLNYKTNSAYYQQAAYAYQDLGDYVQAWNYFATYYTLTDSLYANLLNRSVAREQRDYVVKRLGVYIKKSNLLTFFAIVLSILIVLGLLYLSYYRKTQKKLSQYQKEKIRQLQEIQKLQDDNQKNVLRGMILSTVVTRLKQMAFEETIPSESDWNDLNQLFEEMLPSFERKLRQKNSLSEIEWRICQLEKLGFSNKEVSTLICKAKNTISTANAKLFKQRFGVDGGSSGWLDFIQKL